MLLMLTKPSRRGLTTVGADGHAMEAAATPPHLMGVSAAQPDVRQNCPYLPSRDTLRCIEPFIPPLRAS